MQFWPRCRAKRQYPRVRDMGSSNDVKILGFAGYKVGMTHAIIIDNRKTTLTRDKEMSIPLTIIETPPIKILGVRIYKQTIDGLKAAGEKMAPKLDKEVGRKIPVPKKESVKELSLDNVCLVRAIVHTQPSLTGIGKKMPEIFEIGVGGKDIKAKYDYIVQNLGKEIKINDVLKEGQSVDVHAVSKGKGTQGPVKRFGVMIRSHKAEKTKRGPASLGGWRGQGHIMYRVAHAGKMGYHQRTEYNKWIVKIGEKPEEINTKSGFNGYGVVRNQFILVKGSVAGPSKRMIRMVPSIRPSTKIPVNPPRIVNLIK